MLPALDHVTIPAAGVSLHAVTCGPRDGRPVVLLHGFPEFWYGWRHQLGPLADAGFRVVAPDQRGYNTSDKPPRVADYSLDRTAADAAAVIDWLGVEKACVVGHDWGGAVAWWLALRHPEKVDRLVVINCPLPTVLRRGWLASPRQLLRSWYMFAMQLPWLPEWSSRRRNWQAVVDSMRGSSRPGTFTDEDFARYREAWSQPGAFTAMVNWYRAIVRAMPPVPAEVRIRVPTRLIWGVNDRFIGREFADQSIAHCDDGRVEFVEDATHWVQHEEPERVNRSIVAFLRDV